MERTMLNFYHPLNDIEKILIEACRAGDLITLYHRQYFTEAIDTKIYSNGSDHTTVTLCPVVVG